MIFMYLLVVKTQAAYLVHWILEINIIYYLWSINQMEEEWRGCFLSLPFFAILCLLCQPLSWSLCLKHGRSLNLLDRFAQTPWVLWRTFTSWKFASSRDFLASVWWAPFDRYNCSGSTGPSTTWIHAVPNAGAFSWRPCANKTPLK